MEKYRLVEEHKGDGEDFLEGSSDTEVRITQQGKPRNYISFAMRLFVRKTRITVITMLFNTHAHFFCVFIGSQKVQTLSC